ncbi:myosin-11-like [Physella acuta]|uniref:myosin-11-like n=1 Tax=Physella acuta TaxID=109671 RepID=UPI0027DB0618|nr:myosin-11-like [Physella acuta]
MRPRLQIKFVTEQIQYLEEQILVVEPVISAMKDAIEKSKTWLEDKEGNLSTSYSEISQQLDQANVALLNVASDILAQNIDETKHETKHNLLPSDTQQIESVKQLCLESTQQFNKQIQHLTDQYKELMNTFDAVVGDISLIKENTNRIEKTQTKMGKEIADNESIQQENFRMVKTEQEKISNKNKNLISRIKQQEKRLDEAEKTLEVIKSSDENNMIQLNTLSKEIAETKNCVSNMEKHVDLLTTKVFGKDLSIQDLSAQDKDSVMELLEKTREAFREMDEQNTKSADNLRNKCEDLNKKISDKSKSMNGKVCSL